MNFLEEILEPWVKRHGLEISDSYRDRFYYIDISDRNGGKYELSISREDESELIEVCLSSDQKRRCGYAGVRATELERVLEKAYARLCKWTNNSIQVS